MIITTTSISFITLSIGLGSCGWLFLRCFKKNTSGNEKIGFLLTCLFLGFAIQNGTMGLGTLFFAKNSTALFLTLIASNIFLNILALLGVYIAYYIFHPNRSPYPAMVGVAILGITTIIITLITHPQPFMTPQNVIDLNTDFNLSVLIFYLLLISIGSTVYIFGRLFLQIKNRQIKILSLIIAGLGLAGVINIFTSLILLYDASSVTRSLALNLGLLIIGLIFIITLVILPIFRNKIFAEK